MLLPPGSRLDAAPGADAAPRDVLRSHLTTRAPRTIPDAAWPHLDALFAREAARRTPIRASTLPRLADRGPGARVSFHRGDVTRLDAGAIVNAANAGLTGCYRPFHACVDNAIHTAAGPRLRDACADAADTHTGAGPLVTRGAFLPASWVLHAVGPIVGGGAPSAADAAELARVYRSCLAAAAEIGVESVAFPSISTGVFGYPIAQAARVALLATKDALASPAGLAAAPPHVVFVTFSREDEAVYAALAPEVFHV